MGKRIKMNPIEQKKKRKQQKKIAKKQRREERAEMNRKQLRAIAARQGLDFSVLSFEEKKAMLDKHFGK